MNSVISATTGAVYGAVPAASRGENFLGAARALLSEAYAYLGAEQPDLALESAYRAALRTAGAVLANSPVIAKRKRLPTSAWAKLILTGVRGAYWADVFEGYSRLRGRVSSGIELKPDATTVAELVDRAAEFYAEVAGEAPGMAAA